MRIIKALKRKVDFPEETSVPIGRVGFIGNMKEPLLKFLNVNFGNQWDKKYIYGSEIISRERALELYEESYFQFLQSNEESLEWLINNASDLYDNSPSNIDSKLDYSTQETNATHLQDIAVRRVINRLGKKFKGSRLIQIRGRDSEGYFLNPGVVPFLNPDLILAPRRNIDWISPGTIEDFWQNNKVLTLSKDYYEKLIQDHTIETPGSSYRLSHKDLVDMVPLFCTYNSDNPTIYAIGFSEKEHRTSHYVKFSHPYSSGYYVSRSEFFEELATNLSANDLIIRMDSSVPRGTIRKLKKISEKVSHFSI